VGFVFTYLGEVMTGYQSKKDMAQDKLNEDDDTQVYGDALTIAYQSGYYDGKKAALAGREWNFCPRCGKRTKDIHTCTPPNAQE
jgi:hypothetical protein